MSIYDVNYAETGRQLSSPDKRGPFMRAWLACVLTPMQWLRDLWLGDYRIGSSGEAWQSTTPYPMGSRVIYNGSAYESLVDGNLGNLPTDTTKWVLVQQNFIGVFERMLYNGNVLPFTFAINKYFGTTFRQPNNVSDIFITVHTKPPSVFIVGYVEDQSSVVFSNISSEFVTSTYVITGFVNMTINVPLAVYNALDTVPGNREKIIRNFADRYINVGISYNVVTY